MPSTKSITDSMISVTELQRNLSKYLRSKKEPYRIIMSHNKMNGGLLSAEFMNILLETGVLDQIREELWELNDPETCAVVEASRNGTATPIPFEDFLKEYDLQN